ncbi:hypothetical protein TNCV_2702811 [Trichonephila clavipes]|nr:hypothetical protein TNCV_2702811 [Trichonephila clavipes]
MSDLTDMKKCMIVGTRLVGETGFTTANLAGKLSFVKHNCDPKSKLKDHDRWVLKRLIAPKRMATLPQIMFEITVHP